MSREAKKVPAGFSNRARGEINMSLVYWGPPSAGKTTSLTHIWESISPERRGKLISLETEPQRTIFFDFLPPNLERLNGLEVRVHLFLAPPAEYYEESRSKMLERASGVVFVADTLTSRSEANRSSLAGLRNALAALGIAYEDMPLVLQYNKRDLPGIVAIDGLNAQLNPRGAPVQETVATTGVGVFDCLMTILRLILGRANNPEIAPVLELPGGR